MAKEVAKKAAKEAVTIKSIEELEQELRAKRNDLLEARNMGQRRHRIAGPLARQNARWRYCAHR